jgi:hypothetical protein
VTRTAPRRQRIGRLATLAVALGIWFASLFALSGYLSQEDAYRLGAFSTGVCLLLYLLVGTPWLLLGTR